MPLGGAAHAAYIPNPTGPSTIGLKPIRMPEKLSDDGPHMLPGHDSL
jgi:hypothetical protein